LKRRLVLSYLAVAAVILLALEVPLGLVYARHEHDVAGVGVVHDATALASLADEGVEHRTIVDLQAVASHYRAAVGGDVEIVDHAGAILVAPRSGNATLASATVRGQVANVLRGGPSGVQPVPNVDEVVVVEPIGAADSPAGAVAVAVSDRPVDQRVHRAWLALVVLAGGVLAAVALLGILVARSVTRPLTHLGGAARRLGSGDLGARAPAHTGPTEVRDLSREFNSMAGRLEELVTAQQGFVADASHQLRSPLTALRLRLENLTATLPGAAADGDAMVAELDRLSRVVDGLLMLARSEGERPDRVVINLGEVVIDRVDGWSALADEAGVTLSSSVPEGPAISGWLVPGHVEQIIDNLLANALEATPAGGTVQVVICEDGGEVEIHVIDQGRGLSELERRHAFDRFWRGSASRPGTGSGLGLSIVRQLARANSAEVELREAPGGGIDAVLRLDCRRRSESNPQGASLGQAADRR
jgi:signal transduction histidine kinase